MEEGIRGKKRGKGGKRMSKRKSEELKKENKRIHKNTMAYFKEKELYKRRGLKFRGARGE